MYVLTSLPADNLIKYKKKNILRRTTSCKLKIRAVNNKTTVLRWYSDFISKSLSNQNNDNNFEIESKYHRKTLVLLLTAHILSLQDVVLRGMFFLICTNIIREFSSSNISGYSLNDKTFFQQEIFISCVCKCFSWSNRSRMFTMSEGERGLRICSPFFTVKSGQYLF